jgi:hypothetical protein
MRDLAVWGIQKYVVVVVNVQVRHMLRGRMVDRLRI